ncbi:heat-inducible transcriptional repressor HrcA [Sphingomicrobium sediminis]|uniref:Heat-inducible transcription repressor HrcA n=1 Tax=Sphingomicrobium sediminis TaxID=2950949 RepID=A0A9X2EKQ3_9SPHN|nr:heat-inducible transcriptional repressor HrcA [Sphingomicrobium sediminis]MCM8557177.1 heat-inducible transcriptional repressor HrcA [Sphingomicrobium sediminis]
MSERLDDLTGRMRSIFAEVVTAYLEQGAPVGSKALTERVPLSPASIRGVMAELEARGLLTAPHTSAGRMPTETGLRLFVDGMMQMQRPHARTRAAIENELNSDDVAQALEATTTRLSGLSACAGIVTAPKREARLKQLAFMPLDQSRALAVMVGADGSVENRVVPLPQGTSPIALNEIANYVSGRLSGLTLSEAEARLRRDISDRKEQLDDQAADLVAAGLADWGKDQQAREVLIVRGRANLLDDKSAENLEQVKQLFEELENRQEIMRLLEGVRDGEGVRIFIGSENRMFALSGSSVIAAPYRDADDKVVGVIGVIGPTRLNYARVVPMVDFTAEALTRRMV